MENGDSAHSEHTHRSSNDAGSDELYGIASPQPLPKKGGAFCFCMCMSPLDTLWYSETQKAYQNIL